MKAFKIIFRILKNKYFIITVLFFVWMFFINDNSIPYYKEMKKDLNTAKTHRDYLKSNIKNDSILIDGLTKDPDHLERFAREVHLMKKDNEDIFLVVPE